MSRDAPELPSEPRPRHVAIVMDGNGRWAKGRGQPRAMGHRAGVKVVRRILRAAHKAGVEALTLFAFSQENWKRPETEVKLLIQLFVRTLAREMDAMHRNGVRVRFIGDRSGFPEPLRREMQRAELRTADNAGVKLSIAVGYGGQWDIVQAANALVEAGEPITAEGIEARLQTAGLPEPDLMIRTGGEQRISNFLLWQLAYTELYFSDVLWPDFSELEFHQALAWYAGRERRFGRVPEAS
ncbi:di-trans,poly-cis-decaprenylcistransferase [Solimonas sp. K1W22B-7]|uniref:polyprenyl diphosphate synthase n=1 Tax=Solimonas sp. K1W22B-7 TaxID=2303331 RepID=UPI000E332470|nr:polyprenyl diphosphate synthase [Solimonas sp. K1W22B-7]AXQ28977.1 di-trans,poly-cis-decaprenylcistransferase [Solimonas sp. K1W22B-7]